MVFVRGTWITVCVLVNRLTSATYHYDSSISDNSYS